MITIKRMIVKNVEGSVLFEAENLSLEPGDTGRVYGVVGPSGCGKTTLLKALLGLLPPEQFGDNQLGNTCRVPAYFPQRPVIFPHLNAEQNAKYFAHSVEHCGQADNIAAMADKLAGYLRVDFARLNRTRPDKWSGGEQQRLALIRGLSICPDVIFLDEPCNGLDPCVRWELLSFLRQHVLGHRLLAIYVSHYSDELIRISDDILTFSGAMGSTRRLEQHSLTRLVQAPEGISEYIAPGNYVGAWLESRALAHVDIKSQRVYAPEDIEVHPELASKLYIERIFRFGRQAAHSVIELTGGIRFIVPSHPLPPEGTAVAISARAQP